MVSEIPLTDDGAGVAMLVRQARREAQLSQSALAARIGTTQSAVSRWEHGHDEPRLSSLCSILAACGKRATLRLESTDVDRAQIRQQLSMTPQQRLDSVINISQTLSSAKRIS